MKEQWLNEVVTSLPCLMKQYVMLGHVKFCEEGN